MRHSSVWGGEPELQALSEIYRRPIEIYTTRTTPEHIHGSEFNYIPNQLPVRLHFRGSHYNSIYDVAQNSFVQDETEVGKIESKYCNKSI